MNSFNGPHKLGSFLTLKQMGLDLPIVAEVAKKVRDKNKPKEEPAKPPPPYCQEIIDKKSYQVPEEITKGRKIKVKVNRAMLNWLYQGMQAHNITILMFGKESPEGTAAIIEIKRLRKIRKAFSAFFLIKAEYTDGFNKSLMSDTAKKLGVSLNTLKSRIRTLKDLKLCYEQHDVIKMYSHQRARHQLGINPSANETRYIKSIPNLLYFDYVQDVIYEREMSFTIRETTTHKLRQNDEIAEALVNVCGRCGIRTVPSKLNRQHIQDAQATVFTDSKIRHSIGVEEMLFLFTLNVNEHCNYEHFSKLYGYRGKSVFTGTGENRKVKVRNSGGMAYRKRKWIKLGLAEIYHRQYADQTCEVRPKDITWAGHCHYSRPHKATMFHMVDKIKLQI